MLDSLYERIMNTYTALGYPAELVGHWALPRRDAERLLQEVESAKPQKILEVGTFVGFSTIIMASQVDDTAVIHTIDPDFPLEVELRAMNTKTGDADLTARPQEIAMKAAQRLGLAHKIICHAGGFSTSATFASTKTNPVSQVPVIGPDVCKTQGPFDLIFIDGLHYSEAVLSDLRLASLHLRPGGRIVLHDVMGCWGSNVRRAAFEFLAEAREFVFRHGRYEDLYDAMGILERTSSAQAQQSDRETGVPSGSFLDQPEFVENLAAVVYNICLPKSAIYLGHDRGRFLSHLQNAGVRQLVNAGKGLVSLGHEQDGESSPIREEFDFLSAYKPKQRFDLCICLPDGHDLQECSFQDLVASCVACSDTILFGSTPPGEVGVAGGRALPIESWVREFWRHGYRLHDVIRPHFEPLKFANSYSPVYAVHSSELSNLYLVRREPSNIQHVRDYVEQVLVEKERRIEDLSLQGLFSDVALQHTLKQFKEAQDLLVAKDNSWKDQQQEINDQQQKIVQGDTLIQEYKQAIAEKSQLLREHERTIATCQQIIAEREQTIAHIEQSLEYRLALRVGRYPNFLRFIARIWRAMSAR
jgi:predicted O-methyltransferase YrrM